MSSQLSSLTSISKVKQYVRDLVHFLNSQQIGFILWILAVDELSVSMKVHYLSIYFKCEHGMTKRLGAGHDLSSFSLFHRKSVRAFLNLCSKVGAETTDLGESHRTLDGDYSCHIMVRKESLAGVAITSEDYPHEVVLKLLNELLGNFVAKYPKSHSSDITLEDVSNEECTELIKKYQDEEFVSQIQKEIANAKKKAEAEARELKRVVSVDGSAVKNNSSFLVLIENIESDLKSLEDDVKTQQIGSARIGKVTAAGNAQDPEDILKELWTQLEEMKAIVCATPTPSLTGTLHMEKGAPRRFHQLADDLLQGAKDSSDIGDLTTHLGKFNLILAGTVNISAFDQAKVQNLQRSLDEAVDICRRYLRKLRYRAQLDTFFALDENDDGLETQDESFETFRRSVAEDTTDTTSMTKKERDYCVVQ